MTSLYDGKIYLSIYYICLWFSFATISSSFSGIIVCGNGGSGKTACMENLIEALNEHAASKQLEGSSKTRLHKLERINALAVSDINLMFGFVKPSGDWADGVFSSIWKRSNKFHSVTATTTWICFDAPVQDVWCKNLKSVLDQGKVCNHLNSHI